MSISERAPGEKLAYADGFKQCIEWFEARSIRLPEEIAEARALHTVMLATLDPPKQPAPNDHWCVGCSPIADEPGEQVCSGCERPRQPERIVSERGFVTYDQFKDSYGANIKITESSSASGPHVWIFVDEGGIENNKGAAHLDEDQARYVRDALSAWLGELDG